MDAYKKVIWQEGMFISPQHFQQQDRYLQHYIRQNVETLAGYAPFYGITQLTINHDLLKMGKLSVTSCAGIFPDGTPFQLNHEIVIDIAPNTIDKGILLALPMSLQGNNDYGHSEGDQSRYLSQGVNVFDNSTDENASIEIDVAQLNLRLKMAGEDLSGFTTLPLTKVLECRETGEVILDRSFIPAALHYGAALFLIERVKEINALLNHRVKTLLQRIEAGQEQKSGQALMQDYLWLQTLNSWTPWFELTLNNPNLSTYELYAQLRRFQAELLALQPAAAPACPPLQLDALYGSFNPLFASLREMLTLVQQDSVIEFTWDQSLFEKRRLLRTLIKDPQALQNRRFILTVKSSLNANQLNELFPVAAKLSGNGRIVELVRNALSGIDLHPLPVAPSELRPSPGLAYFEINDQHPLWLEMLNNRDALALHVDARIPTLDVVLYALK
ncbi:type VI secretion system baseplate subunit TssK [Motilimonas sp. 1_MG-2023]|uniref:type VI secretion system baseplate subunit TssK n=1 Tax=unclassified Motilimonas TaxID=2643697 RepID=UPI001E283DBA|nr:type VI secretion system baseplate subunit TssK [Motilimonas sp. 1_MG-2023]MCE0557529.1 type VI secretion system baseplate subunit TssK [Motilimonas sp. E26]MDO6524587.1 type VI secretion system baseplate subunit TssK [Motilimonas sp. 1_MG-2023]